MVEPKNAQYIRRERMMLAVESVLVRGIPLPGASSECKARCAQLQGGKKQECEDECDAWQAAALVAERLRRDLVLSFRDIIWSGGDIDPVPDPFALERAVRDRFEGPDSKTKP